MSTEDTKTGGIKLKKAGAKKRTPLRRRYRFKSPKRRDERSERGRDCKEKVDQDKTMANPPLGGSSAQRKGSPPHLSFGLGGFHYESNFGPFLFFFKGSTIIYKYKFVRVRDGPR